MTPPRLGKKTFNAPTDRLRPAGTDSWCRVRPVSTFWSRDDPSDPDFTLEYHLDTPAVVRIIPCRTLRVALRVAGKRLAVSFMPGSTGDRWTVTVTVGLTSIHRIAGTRLDAWLSRLVTVQVRTPDATRADHGADRRVGHGVTDHRRILDSTTVFLE